MVYNEFQYVLAVQNFHFQLSKKEAKFLPISAKPHLPAAAQAGSMFFLQYTKMTRTIFRLKDQAQWSGLMWRKQEHVLAYTPVQCKVSMYVKMFRINLQVQFICSMYRFEVNEWTGTILGNDALSPLGLFSGCIELMQKEQAQADFFAFPLPQNKIWRKEMNMSFYSICLYF